MIHSKFRVVDDPRVDDPRAPAIRTEREIRDLLDILEFFNSTGKYESEILALKWVLRDHPHSERKK